MESKNSNRRHGMPVSFDYSKFGVQACINVEFSDLIKTHDAVLSALKNGLPEEAHTVDVFNYVLDQCKDTVIHEAKLKL